VSELATRTPMQEVLAEIAGASFMAKLANALPANVAPQRFVSVTVTAVKQNPALITADRDSLYNSVVRCAQDGLFPDGREAALVMFGKQVQYMPMITGLRKRLAEHGFDLTAYVVYENDDFDYQLGDDPWVKHKPAKLGTPRGEPLGAYAVAEDMRTHKKYVDVMDVPEIEQVRKVSRAANNGPWQTWWGEQARKTVGRRLAKTLPLPDNNTVMQVLAAIDAEYDLPNPNGPTMTVDEANVAAPLSNLSPPNDGGPDDSIQDAEYEDPIDDADLEAAARVLVPKGVYNERGLDIGQVAGLGVEGSTWILSTLKKPRTDASLNGFRDSLELFVKGRLPEVWSVYEAWKQGQS
jgi:recombination protein RecT